MKKKTQARAVALKYQAKADKAPRIKASGSGKTADRIIEIAKQHNIYIQNDPDLVEVLSGLDLNEEIPPKLYFVVAELLAFVYFLNSEKNISSQSNDDEYEPAAY